MNVAIEIARLCRIEHHPDLPGPELLPTRLMRAAAAVLPVAAAGISAFSRFRHRVPLGASEDAAALAERLQFTVGQGPCLAAHAQLRTIVATADVMTASWPAFHNELTSRTPTALSSRSRSAIQRWEGKWLWICTTNNPNHNSGPETS